MSESVSKSRIKELDILKGIAIILMVYGHCYLYGRQFIYLFHIASFVIAAGCTYDSQSNLSLNKLFKKTASRLKGLYIPYITFNLIYYILTPVFQRIGMIENSIKLSRGGVVQILLFHGYTEFAGPGWFLRGLFIASVSYFIIDYILGRLFDYRIKLVIQGILSLLLLIGSYFVSFSSSAINLDIKCLENFYILFFIGTLFRKIYIEKLQDRITIKVMLIQIVCSLIFLMILEKFGRIELVLGEITNPSFFIVVSTIGFLFLYSLVRILNKWYFIQNLFCAIGKNTLSVLLMHFFVFKLVNLLIVLMKDLPKENISASPTLYGNTVWGALYVFTGVFIPVGISIVFKKIKGKSVWN